MKRGCIFFLFLAFIFCFLLVKSSYSQEEKDDIEELKKKAPKVFIDCRRCDIDYIRTEITFVNYVWDRKSADVHILITTQTTGSGGTEYTMAFMGLKDYKDLQNTLKFVSKQTDTDDDIRKGIVKVLKRGLIPYVSMTPIADRISISFKEKVKPTDVEDKWNFWTFGVSVYSFLYGQKTVKSHYFSGSLSANRITPKMKLRLSLSSSLDKSIYEVDDETISSSSDRQSFSSLYVKSISEHWSVGAWLSARSDTYRNIRFSFVPAPAVEYNLFPYSQSTRRQLRFLYKLQYGYYHYWEETIYDKMKENLWSESLSVTLSLKEPWGSASISVEGSHYFHDFKYNRIEVDANMDIRLFKGLSFRIYGSYAAIHDQLNLIKGGATLEEILLSRTELETNYTYYASVGFSYTFGSIFSNVVNPRFGR